MRILTRILVPSENLIYTVDSHIPAVALFFKLIPFSAVSRTDVVALVH